MIKDDINYLCTILANLCGMPLRLFEGDRLITSYSPVILTKDPMTLYQSELLTIDAHVSYYVTQMFDYYGVINSGHYKLILGPTRQIPYSDQELKDLAFRSDVATQDLPEFISSMKRINRIPLNAILQALCAVNYCFSGEKLNLKDIVIYKETQKQISQLIGKHSAEQFYKYEQEVPFEFPTSQNSYDAELTLLNYVRTGDSNGLNQWLSTAAVLNEGTLASDQLRQAKNTFIVSTSITTRSAIQGGLDPNDAFFLSDSYIQQCELLSSPLSITNLQYHMIIDFTERVANLHIKKDSSKLVRDIITYIHHHLSESITVESIANHLFMSRPYLSTKFKAETGENLTDFILSEKIKQAKDLLKYSEKSISAISDYLGFSSQSHFSRVFRKYTSNSPIEYRMDRKNSSVFFP